VCLSEGKYKMIALNINDNEVKVIEGSTVATAIIASGTGIFRRSVSGEPRLPLCGMGVCFECRVTINGVKYQRSCQLLAEEGMVVNCEL